MNKWKKFVTQLWLFWHGQHGKIVVLRGGFLSREYQCLLCESRRSR